MPALRGGRPKVVSHAVQDLHCGILFRPCRFCRSQKRAPSAIALTWAYDILIRDSSTQYDCRFSDEPKKNIWCILIILRIRKKSLGLGSPIADTQRW